MLYYTFPKRTTYEQERNYFWEKYFKSSLSSRAIWKYLDYTTCLENGTSLDLVYSANPKLSRLASINANMYNIVDAISDKVKMNRQLFQAKSQFIPRMLFLNKNKLNESEITALLQTSKTFFYLKGSSGSISRTTFIIKVYNDIVKAIKDNPEVPSWMLSENIESYLYKRQGKYQPDGIVYNEKYGHKGRLKFFIVFKNDNSEKNVWMYDQAVYEIAPDEFKGDYSSRSQNIIIGMGSEELHGYPENYDTDPDYGFSPVSVFGDSYFSTIVPQLAKITHDLFNVSHNDLYCKNSKYYNRDFKSCFHFGTVDVIIGPDLACYFLEINTKPVMDRPSYESIINYPSMIDSLVQICIDPYFPPPIQPGHIKGWHKISYIKNGPKQTFYVANSWRLSKQVKNFYKHRDDWEMIIYPKHLLPEWSIDFVGKRKLKSNTPDTIFKKGILISKIYTLDYYLGNKKLMYDILSNDKRSFTFLPLTATFSTHFQGWQDLVKKAMATKKVWILKPSIGMRGQDILIENQASKIINYVNIHLEYTDWVLSEYIDKPFLLKIYGNAVSGARYDDHIGRKVHIRIYVLITKINKKYNIYLYEKSLLFCASKEYTDDIKDTYSNLTNLYLGSLYYESMGLDGSLAYQDLSFPLEQTVNQLYGNSFYKKKVFPQIKSMLKIILQNSKDYLQCKNKNCFQYIAIDVMPDINWKLYLLEVNGRPGMNAPQYHWGNLMDFTNSLLNKTSERLNKTPGRLNKTNKNKEYNVSKKGFILIQ